MPNPKLLDKYKGKPFGEIANAISKKYEDRHDPISNRGKMAEMSSLKDEQEYQRTKLEIQQNIKNVLSQAQQPQVAPEVPMAASNEGVSPEMTQPVQDQSVSASYNEQFALGGNLMPGMEDINSKLLSPGVSNYMNGIKPTGPMSAMNTGNNISENVNPLRYAPLLANIYGIVGTRKPKSTASTMAGMGIKTQVDETLANQAIPRQTQFDNIDYSGIERGITNQARAFTGTNANVSGGNAGSFVANELGNQGNIMDAITQARVQQQTGDQRVAQLNAGEQARIDQFGLTQSGQKASIQGQNIGIGMQMADLDARNQGAATSNVMANIAGLATNLGTIGKEEDQMKMIANALGYSSFGNFMESMSPEEREQALPSLLKILSGVTKSRG